MTSGADTDFNIVTGPSGYDRRRRTRKRCRFLNIQDGCPLSCSERSAKSIRTCRNPQVMKVSDPLLAAWQKTLHRRGDAAAILDENGATLRTFQGVEKRADELIENLAGFEPGGVVAVQIGNHPDWPSIFLACRRRKLVVVPLDQSISAQDRATALETCRASGLIENGRANGSNQEAAQGITLLHQPVVRWGDHPPSLLKLTSGTTAAPRAVRFRSEQLIADCIQIATPWAFPRKI